MGATIEGNIVFIGLESFKSIAKAITYKGFLSLYLLLFLGILPILIVN